MWMIGYAVFGLVAGVIARMLHPGRDPMNWLWTMLLGIGGAEVGGFAARQMGYDPSAGLTAWIAAIAGSVLLLVGYHMMTAPAAQGARLRQPCDERRLQTGRHGRPVARPERVSPRSAGLFFHRRPRSYNEKAGGVEPGTIRCQGGMALGLGVTSYGLTSYDPLFFNKYQQL